MEYKEEGALEALGHIYHSFKWLYGFILLDQDNSALLFPNTSLNFICKGGVKGPLTCPLSL